MTGTPVGSRTDNGSNSLVMRVLTDTQTHRIRGSVCYCQYWEEGNDIYHSVHELGSHLVPNNILQDLDAFVILGVMW